MGLLWYVIFLSLFRWLPLGWLSYLFVFILLPRPLTRSRRQTVLGIERRPNALPQALALPVRSLSHHGHVLPTPPWFHRLGRPPLSQTLASTLGGPHSPF